MTRNNGIFVLNFEFPQSSPCLSIEILNLFSYPMNERFRFRFRPLIFEHKMLDNKCKRQYSVMLLVLVERWVS